MNFIIKLEKGLNKQNKLNFVKEEIKSRLIAKKIILKNQHFFTMDFYNNINHNGELNNNIIHTIEFGTIITTNIFKHNIYNPLYVSGVFIDDVFLFFSDILVDVENDISFNIIRSFNSKGNYNSRINLNCGINIVHINEIFNRVEIGNPNSSFFNSKESIMKKLNIKNEIIYFLLIFKLPIHFFINKYAYNCVIIDGIMPIKEAYHSRYKILEFLFGNNNLNTFINKNSDNVLKYFFNNKEQFNNVYGNINN